MTERDSADFSAEDLANPNIDAATLAQLAQSRRDLWTAIQQHPNCYPELHHWIAQQIPPPFALGATGPNGSWSAAGSSEQYSQSPVHPTPEQWAAQFQQDNGREPTMSEFQFAQSSGQIAQERRPVDPSMQQISEGAKQLAAGAKDFLSNRVAPVAVGATRTVHHSISEQAVKARGGTGWQAWVPIALPASALFGAIALIFPAASTSASGWGFSFSNSESFFEEDAGGLGWWLLIFMLAVLALGIVSITKRTKWARITAGVVGLIAGVFAAFVGFGVMAAVSDFGSSNMGVSSSATVGPGAVILALASLGLLGSAVLTLASLRRSPAAGVPQQPWGPQDPPNHPHV